MKGLIEVGAASALLLCCTAAVAGSPPSYSSLARELVQGCLKTPTSDSVSHLAAQLGATPYSEVRRRQEMKSETSQFPDPGDNRDQRTRTTVTEYRGWDLPQAGAGTLAYEEKSTEVVWVDHATGQPMSPVSGARDHACQLSAPVARARTMFELFEALTTLNYGIRISADRRWVDVFMFDPDRYDIELSFALDAPLAGLPAGRSEGRLVLTDGGSRISNYVGAGIEPVTLMKASFLAGLDQTATMSLINEAIEPMVQRLARVGR
jgi:hypothetical protein